MMRAMLAAIGAGRIETHENPALSLSAMERSKPDLLIAAAFMQEMSGSQLVRSMRREHRPLCFVPAMIMGSHAKAGLVAEALRSGAHQVLVLPTSASTLYRRLDWLVHDDRPFELKDGHYVVSGLEERLALSVPRPVYNPAPAHAPLAVSDNDTLPEAEAARLRAAQN